jgi:hypothetical protein
MASGRHWHGRPDGCSGGLPDRSPPTFPAGPESEAWGPRTLRQRQPLDSVQQSAGEGWVQRLLKVEASRHTPDTARIRARMLAVTGPRQPDLTNLPDLPDLPDLPGRARRSRRFRGHGRAAAQRPPAVMAGAMLAVVGVVGAAVLAVATLLPYDHPTAPASRLTPRPGTATSTVAVPASGQARPSSASRSAVEPPGSVMATGSAPGGPDAAGRPHVPGARQANGTGQGRDAAGSGQSAARPSGDRGEGDGDRNASPGEHPAGAGSVTPGRPPNPGPTTVRPSPTGHR